MTARNGGTRARLSLDGEWYYRPDPDDKGSDAGFFKPGHDVSGEKRMPVPINWYRTEVGDYHGVVWFWNDFEIPADFDGRVLQLRFEAVDYIADVWVNGTYLGGHEGYFAPFAFDVTAHVRAGRVNRLAVRVDSPLDPTEYVMMQWADNLSTPMSDPYKVHWPVDMALLKGVHVHAQHRPGSFTSFGQDCNTGGIYRGVELIAADEIRITGARIYTKIVHEDNTALVAADVELFHHGNETVRADVAMRIQGENFQSETVTRVRRVVLRPGPNSVKLVQTIAEPRLWWSHDQGRPDLYQARFTVTTGGRRTDDVKEVFGIRELVVGEDGVWRLNGRRMFIRGMRYVSSIWLSEMNRERYEEDLRKMCELNVNAIRLGSHVEGRAFYDLCDRMGILVWQVFPIHFAVRDDDVVIEKAATMMKEMVRMLYNHASIVIWSVAKEPQIYPLRASHRNNNYGRLCEIMYESGKTVDPIRWMHKGDYGEGVQNFTPGYCLPGDTDVRKHPLKPQIVEFHTSALPCMETMKQIMSEEDLWPPNWDRWSWLGFQYNIWINSQKIEIGQSLEEFIENSQSYAYRANKEIIEFLRQRKYAPVASMFYHYWNDPFPQIGCGLLDYFRRPYRHYDSLALCYTPVLVSLEWCRDTHVLGFEKVYRPEETFVAKIWLTNDRGEVLPDCSVGWSVQDEAGKVVAEKELVVSIPADASRVIDVLSVPLLGQRGRRLTVRMTLRDGGGSTLSTNAFPFRVSA